MAYVYYVAMFDGSDWRPYGEHQWVTEAGADREVARLKEKFPSFRFKTGRTRPQVLSRLVQQVA